LRGFAIPTTLHASLLARLDRLASVRPVAQIGAAIGRQFPYALLRAVSSLPEDELQGSLAHLVSSELVSQRGAPPEALYSFKHALVQDAAHNSLLRDARRQLHARIAETLEADFSEITESQPELLAQHYAEAGLGKESVAYWGKAGRRSVARSAMSEAAAQFQKGLDQLALLPDSSQRQRQELEFHDALGGVFRTIKGFAAVETGGAFASARRLWEQLDCPSEFLQIPLRQATYHALRGEFDLALYLAQYVLHLSRQRNDMTGVIAALHNIGQTLMFTGRFASARSHIEEALALYDPIAHPGISERYVPARGNLAIVLFCLGHLDQARSEISAIVTEAGRLAQPSFLVLVRVFAAILLSLIGDNVSLDKEADKLVAAAIEHGFSLYHAQGTIFRGWVKVRYGNISEGIDLLRSGSDAYRGTGSEVWTPHYRALLATAFGIAGQVEESLTLMDDTLNIVARTGERWFAAELNRLKGQILLRQGQFEEAQELYHKALSIAREQEAKLWELRAAVSLAQLWRDQGRRADARDLLAPVYGWFAEGFDTPDLKEAGVLLDELKRRGRK
jgi:predicted ATPase